MTVTEPDAPPGKGPASPALEKKRWLTKSDLIVVIFLAGIFIRLVYINNVATTPWNDMYDYYDISVGVSQGLPFGSHNRFPLFILVNSILFKLFGVSYFIPRAWNVCCSVMVMFLIYKMTLAISKNDKIAICALLLAAFHHDLIFFNAPILYEMTMMVTVCLTIYVIVFRRWYWLGGFALFLAVMAKPTNVILLPLLLLDQELRKRGGRRFLLIGLVFLILMAPWWTRNYLVFNKLLFAGPGGGMMFYLGNHPGQENSSDLAPRIVPEMRYYQEFQAIYAKYQDHNPDSHMFVLPEAEKYFVLEALHLIKEHPGLALANYLKKFFVFFSSRHSWFLDYYYSYDLIGSFLPEFINITLWVLAGYAFLCNWRHGHVRFLALTILAYGALYAVFSVLHRYRLVILPLVIVGAAIGINTLRLSWQKQKQRHSILLLGLLLFFIVTTGMAA